MLNTFMILLIIVSFTACGIGLENVAHPNYDLAESTRQLKTDVSRVVSVLFSSNYQRHIFDSSLWEHFLKILDNYYHTSFTPNYQATFYDGTPLLRINFVPCRELAPAELNRLCKLLCLKLNQYLQLYGLCWKTFVEYHIINDTITINIFYSEHKEDLQPFLKRYRIAVKRKTDANQGVLHDDELDREINYAKPKH